MCYAKRTSNAKWLCVALENSFVQGDISLFGIQYQKYICEKIDDFEQNESQNCTIKAKIKANTTRIISLLSKGFRENRDINLNKPREKI